MIRPKKLPDAKPLEARKICLFFPVLGGGGVEQSMSRLGKEFLGRGYEVDLVVMRTHARHEAIDIPEGIGLFSIECTELFRSTRRFGKYLEKNKPDVIISAGTETNTVAYWANRIYRINAFLLISHRGVEVHLPKSIFGIKANIVRQATRRAYNFADRVVCVSRAVAVELTRILGVEQERVHVIYNPVWVAEVDVIARGELKHEWFLKKDFPIVVSVGRLSEEKDHLSLIEAFSALRREVDARLVIIGEGDQRRVLENRICDLGIDQVVWMPGFIQNPFPYMASSDVFVLTSHHEGFGNVLVESMAVGTPVVSVDCPGGPAEILDRGRYGTLVPPGDTIALANAIKLSLDRPVSADLLKERAKEFSVEKAADAYLGLVAGLSTEASLGRPTIAVEPQ